MIQREWAILPKSTEILLVGDNSPKCHDRKPWKDPDAEQAGSFIGSRANRRRMGRQRCGRAHGVEISWGSQSYTRDAGREWRAHRDPGETEADWNTAGRWGQGYTGDEQETPSAAPHGGTIPRTDRVVPGLLKGQHQVRLTGGGPPHEGTVTA